jgi:phosphatidylserine/phosphatidylglycerophosphate/cardiolipin synthase-like enzyme
MAVRVSVIANCDDAVVFWKVEKPIKDCWGFAVKRERVQPGGGVQRITLDNRVGFAKDNPRPGDHRPSTVWPFQRFWWADHSVNSGDRVRYRVVPVMQSSGALHEDVGLRSKWSKWTELSGEAGDGFAAYFNRGLVISQFMARYLDDLRRKKGLETRDEALKEFKKSLDEHELPIRRFLSGVLRERMLDVLNEAKQKKQHVFGALYELEDGELVEALARLGGRGHLVLANGSIQKEKGETSAEARKRDQNAKARRRLEDAGLEMHGRFISPGALGHNKFLVIASNTKKPVAAWTGSTNWTKTGLCTQVNNGLLVKHAGFAREFMEQWTRLRDAKSEFPDSLIEANSKPKKVGVGKSRAEIWFTRTAKKADLAAIDDAIEGAGEGVLFLMFQPGAAGTLGTIRGLLKKTGKLYVKGVVSTLPPEGATDEDHVDAVSFGDGETHSVGLDIVQPEGVRRPFSSWAATVTRNEFLFGPGKIGFAIVHSKLIVVDPFTRPVVITGSHNFSTSASARNDENFVIVRGNTELATEYAAHILSVYHHYRWLAYVNDQQEMGKNPAATLRESDTWQARHLKGASGKELQFWVR